ncbi:MAG: dTMP kinase [Candidatus Ancillula trichonymphae]|jgi:dTMP kinase|nr:dTMP kinase [Candidatus Ancillula trichonymphae]
MSGVFITFEGIDQSGKSTQIEHLIEQLNAKCPEREVVRTFEPGATELGAKLRTEILHEDAISACAELLLYLADRAENVSKIVLPALARGCVVISDRYIDSTVAYQCAGRKFSEPEIAKMMHLATDGLVPDLTFLLDITVAESRRRLSTLNADRLEQESNEFFERVRSGYLKLAEKERRIYTLDATLPADNLARKIYEVVLNVLE